MYHDTTLWFRRFQEAFLLYPSGVIDVPTLAKMSEYRCANRDMYNGAQLRMAAGATRPINSQIILEKTHLWGYRKHEPRGISLFHTLLHEIGHSLGLPHNFYRGSIMYPMLKPAMVPYGTLDDVPNVDKVMLNKLYGDF
ncbi:Matrixin [Teladorsagia circumcincta]|uniref:Matrixin n=1 Tax=Teladorsagia circumcincta TaxID=45464 RepID=A0A2G9TNK4_TELCI|nr:Matrixin [Teladorsagia circumcincta]